MEKPFSPSADRNKSPILEMLRSELTDGQSVLELGSGTGQHVCHFAEAMPGVTWQPTELNANIPAINAWLAGHKLDNVLKPLTLDVDSHPWPITDIDVCFTSNTFHIVSLESVYSMFSGSAAALKKPGKLCVYGPFSINGQHTSAGNASFDQQLRASAGGSGIRDLQELDIVARQYGFEPSRYTRMPANNLFIVWELLT